MQTAIYIPNFRDAGIPNFRDTTPISAAVPLRQNSKQKNSMEKSSITKEELLRNARILQWKTEILIEACTGWLSAEEGNRNMEKQIIERRRRESNVPKICKGGFETRPYNNENDKKQINNK